MRGADRRAAKTITWRFRADLHCIHTQNISTAFCNLSGAARYLSLLLSPFLLPHLSDSVGTALGGERHCVSLGD